MGSTVVGHCACGFHGTYAIGGGMQDFQATCLFPCLCVNCKRIVQVNLLEKTMECPECGTPDPIPYDDPRLIGIPGSMNVASWYVGIQSDRELVLTNGTYKCPDCGKMTLRFQAGALWD